jgi:hypothetical protein
MTTKLDAAAARVLAAQIGVTLDDDQARNAASAMAGVLATADRYARDIPFEAEASLFLAAQREGKR